MNDYDGRTPISVVPCCVFQSQSLLELSLDGSDLEFDFHANVISLPNLKKLRINNLGGHDSHRELTKTLFESCPLLEYLILSFHGKGNDHVVNISAPNLKTLTITDGGIWQQNEFIIDAPKLARLNINGYLLTYHFVSIPTKLMKANVSLWESHVPDDDPSSILGLVQGIQCVRSLYLRDESPTIFSFLSDLDDNELPVFHNLIHLEYTIGLGEGMSEGAPLPACFLRKVRSIKVQQLSLRLDGIKVLEYFLSNAVDLEKLLVSLNVSKVGSPMSTSAELEFCDALFKLSRSSACCRVEFGGEYVHESSNSLKH